MRETLEQSWVQIHCIGIQIQIKILAINFPNTNTIVRKYFDQDST